MVSSVISSLMLCCLFTLQGIFILLLYYVCLFLFPALAFTFSLLGSTVLRLLWHGHWLAKRPPPQRLQCLRRCGQISLPALPPLADLQF
jgi:hypothetical protein